MGNTDKTTKKTKGLIFKRQYTNDKKSPYDMFEYDYRTSVIRNPNGEKVFEMTNVEVPKHWSQIATDILAQKYFRKAGVPQEDGSKGRETSVKQVAHRLAECWKKWGNDYGYFATPNDAQVFYDELIYSILAQSCAPNSPQWFNTGLFNSYGINSEAQGHYYVDPATGILERSKNAYEHPQPHACARGNTKVFTNKGVFNIKYVVDNFKKLSPIKVFDGNSYVDIVAAKNNGTRDIFKMSMKNGNYIEFTNDHQIMVADKRIKEGGKYGWEELAFCLGKKAMQYSDDGNNCDVLPEVLKIESAELMGYAVGDGYHGRYKQRNEANEQSQFGVITINDEEFERVTTLFTDVLGGYSVYNDIDINENYNTVKFDHKSVNKFCDEYDFTDKKSINKIVPEKVFSGSGAVRRAFLNGLFQADGCVRVYNGKNSGDVTLTTISEQLAHDVQTLLLSVGIYSRIDKGVDKRKNRAQSYYVRISNRSETIKFEKIIGFTSSDKREKLKKLNSVKGKTKHTISEETVSSIEYSCTEEVYDIQTTSGQFCANGILVHNCFILSVEDDLVNAGGIMDLWVREARIFKYGSGVGTNYSNIRAEGEKLSGGGTSSGLMSFLKIGDRAAGAIKSGGTTRRAAKMVCLDLDHPEVVKFIDWKVEEEQKVAALIAGGYASDYEGEAYKTVSGQNSNNSVRVPNSFFKQLNAGGDWEMTARSTGKTMSTIPAKELWDKIAYSAWRCADPGTQYDTTINEWHTCPEGGRIRASNPCVTGDTLIATENGYERIINLVDKCLGVINGTGGTSIVDKIFKTGTKKVYEIKTKHGFKLKVTEDHLISTDKGDVAVNKLVPEKHSIILGKPTFGKGSIDTQFGELLGMSVGDGCISNNEQETLSVTMSKDEYSVAEAVTEHVNYLKRKNYTDDRSVRPTNIYNTKTTLKITTSVKTITEELKEYAVLNEYSENKIFKDKIFTLDKKSISSILRGLFTADGCVCNYENKFQYVALDSTSLVLLQQVQLMLLQFGIKGKIYENRRGDKLKGMLPDGKGGKIECDLKQSHSLYISKMSRFVFENEIGFMVDSTKAIQLRDMNSGIGAYSENYTDLFTEIKYIGEEDVYDLTEKDTNHFVANGMIVHNCSEYMFLDNTACNLASLNLRRFFDEESGKFDVEGFEYMTRLWTVVLEVSVLMAQFPSPEVAQLSYDYRTLGLGYANLGSMLMVNGIAYDSEEGRAIGGAISAIMSGVAYKTSAEMASCLGAFARYEENKEHMLRVMRNHRCAAYNDSKSYDNLEIKPVGINAKYCPDYLLNAAQDAWDEAVNMGEKYGYRNAQTTVIAPTGTIGLVMDCDTTGVEPDFALVKFKKLSGGGYFKIINQSIPAALKKLGYKTEEIIEIEQYAKGHGSLENCPFINHKSLISKGFTTEDLRKLDLAVESAFEINFVFNRFSLGDECMQRLGFKPEQYENVDFNLLQELKFTQSEIDAANDYACGTMTIEGAPFLKNKHLSVFDCANKCGKKGERFIHAKGHIKMMAAVQPFISGAISKTINLPNEATIDEIKECYLLSWQLGVKACALYRDGSKLSQPLSTKSDSKESKEEEVDKPVDITKMDTENILDELSKRMKTSKDTKLRNELSKIVELKKMPAKRAGFSFKAKIAGQPIFLRTAQYSDGTLGEININMSKEGATMKALLNSFATATSIGLQYGVPLEEYVDKFAFTKFEPQGLVDHPNLKTASSVLDYVFRVLAYEYLDREDLIHVADPEKKLKGQEEEEEVVKVKATLPKKWEQNQEVKKLLGTSMDAPICSSCGNITLRNGTCYMCPNCGTTTGCS